MLICIAIPVFLVILLIFSLFKVFKEAFRVNKLKQLNENMTTKQMEDILSIYDEIMEENNKRK